MAAIHGELGADNALFRTGLVPHEPLTVELPTYVDPTFEQSPSLPVDAELDYPKPKNRLRGLLRAIKPRRSSAILASDFNAEWEAISIQEDQHPVLILIDDAGVDGRSKAKAIQLHTEAYLREGIISTEALNEKGQFVDRYTPRSKHYYVENGASDAAARQITVDKGDGIFSLPTFAHFVCDPQEVIRSAGISRISELKPEQVVEISGLTTRRKEGGGLKGDYDALLSLYSTMLKDSLESGVKLWVQNVEPGLLRILNSMAGDDQVTVLGEKRPYMGPDTIPVALSPEQIVRKKLEQKDEDLSGREREHRKHLVGLLQGLNGDKLSPDMRKLFDDVGIEYTRSSLAERIVKNPQTWLQVGVAGYSALRAIPAAMVSEFQGDIGVFLATDLLTAPTYTWGMYKMFTGKSTGEKAVGASVAVPSFIAPYAYWYSQGENYPAYVNLAVAGFVSAGIALEVKKRRDAHKADQSIMQDFRRVEDNLSQV